MEVQKGERSKKFDLENRLVRFAVEIIRIVESLPNSKAGNHMANQLIKSGTSPALNYGEAQSAESRNDFIHKIKIILKELRETLISLKIIQQSSLLVPSEKHDAVMDECNQLISIFVKSVKTAQANKS